MLSIAKMAAFTYYELQSRRDYYSTGVVGAGEWFGRGAKALGLLGEVLRAAFQHLARGFAPDGETKLVQNAGLKDRFVGFDLTFSAPKSVSIVWGLERSTHTRKAIERAMVEAVKDALRFVEDTALFTRRGKGGAIVERALGMVASLWLHATSRTNDCQLHVHACVKNQVQRRDGTWGTILGITAKDTDQVHKKSRSALFAIKSVGGQVFRESLAQRIAALGYVVRRTRDSFEVEGVQPLVERYSTRSLEIKRVMKERGVTGAREAAKVALLTRTSKKSVAPDELFRRWQAQAPGFDPATLRVNAPVHIERPTIATELRARLADTVAKVHTHVLAPSVLGGRTANGATASPVWQEHVRATNRTLTARDWTKREEDVRNLEGQARDARVFHRPLVEDPSLPRTAAAGESRRTLRAVCAETRSTGPGTHHRDDDDSPTLRAAALVARILKRARRDHSHVLTRANVFIAAKQVEYLQCTHLSKGEKQALVTITRKRGSIQFLGSGKSAERIAPVLKAARVAWQRQGYRVLLATSSRSEADHFEKRTGIHSITTAGLLKGLATNRGLLRGFDAAFAKAFKLGLGFRSGTSFVNYALKASGRWLTLNSKTVLVVEGSRLDLTERANLLKRVQRAGAKIVFVDRTRDASDISERLVRPRHNAAQEESQQNHWRDREREHKRSR